MTSSVDKYESQGMSLEELLRTMVPVGPNAVAPEGTLHSPEFRIAVQEIMERGVRVIVHCAGVNSDTLDFVVTHNTCVTLKDWQEIISRKPPDDLVA